MSSDVEQMRAILLATDAEGLRLYSDQEIRSFIPYLLITFAPAIDPRNVPPAVLEMLGDFAEELGVSRASRKQIVEAVRAHYATHPPDAGLVESFQRYFREVLTSRGEAGISSELTNLIGAAEKNTAPHVNEKRTGKMASLTAHLFKNPEDK